MNMTKSLLASAMLMLAGSLSPPPRRTGSYPRNYKPLGRGNKLARKAAEGKLTRRHA